MNREEMIGYLVATVDNWRDLFEGMRSQGWQFIGGKFCHVTHDPIAHNDWFQAAASADINATVLAEKVGAADVLTAGAKHLQDRATTYDNPEGERSMGATVEAFESIAGHSLTEEQGWLFMALLKAVRSQQGGYRLDNYEDGAAYFALMAEAASKGRKS